VNPDVASQAGWEAVASSGVVLPLPVEDTPDQHMRVDDAFNAAAVALVRNRPFDDVLHLTERTHANLIELLEKCPVDSYGDNSYLYRRMVLVVAHHVEHRVQLGDSVGGSN